MGSSKLGLKQMNKILKLNPTRISILFYYMGYFFPKYWNCNQTYALHGRTHLLQAAEFIQLVVIWGRHIRQESEN